MNTINRDLVAIIKDMPQKDIELNIVTQGNQQFYEYRCNFVIDQVAAYAVDVRTMQIDIAFKRVGKTFSLLGNKTFASNTDINQALLNTNKIKKEFIEASDKDQKNSTILVKRADIFAVSPKISKFRLKQTRFIDLQSIESSFIADESLPKNTVLKAAASDLVIKQAASLTSRSDIDIYTTLVGSGKDPASLIESKSLVQDATTQRQGTGFAGRQQSGISRSFATTIASGNANNNLPSALKSRLQQRLTTDVKLPYTFRIPTSGVPATGKFVIICTIRKNNGDLVQKIDFTVNHAKQITKYNIPKSLPATGIQFASNNSAKISIFNKDPRVTGIKIFKRNVPQYQNVAEQPAFTSIKDVSANWKTQAITERLSVKTTSNILIRCTPILVNGIVLGNFDSKNYTQKSDVISGTVVATSNMGYVTVELYGSPANYKYVQFARRSITRHQKEFQNVGEPIKSDGGTSAYDDYAVRKEEVYEYAAFLQDAYGSVKRARSTSIVKVSDYTSNTSLVVSQKSKITNGAETTTTFNLQVKLVNDSDITAILAASNALGIETYYENETLKLAGDLTSATKVNVKRISVDTGVIKDLGVVDLGDFIDSTTENVVYIFEGLLRGQPDLFEEIGSKKTAAKIFDPKDAFQRSQIVSSALTSTQQINKSNFTQKFLSKKSLLKGTLSYGNTKNSDVDGSGFLQGRLGITETVSVTRPISAITITNFDLIVADQQRRIISFDVLSNNTQKDIDFFIISTERGGIRSVIGACHYNTAAVRQNFLDNKTNLTNGSITYIITPVGYDGRSLSEVTSQRFEVF